MNEITLNNNTSRYQDKYENHLNERDIRASVFSDPIRRTLLKMKGPRNNVSGFWCDIRAKVQYGLKEFELFFEAVPDKRIKKIISSDQIKSLLETILPISERNDQPPTIWRKHMAAEIANNNLEYLLKNNTIKSINDQTDLYKAIGIIQQYILDSKPYIMIEDVALPDFTRESKEYKMAKQKDTSGKGPDGKPISFTGPDDPRKKRSVWDLMQGNKERKFKRKGDKDAQPLI